MCTTETKNVFSEAIDNWEKEPNVLRQSEQTLPAEAALRNKITNQSRHIAVVGPKGAGKAAIFQRVFSDDNKEAWKNEGVLVVGPVAYPNNLKSRLEVFEWLYRLVNGVEPDESIDYSRLLPNEQSENDKYNFLTGEINKFPKEGGYKQAFIVLSEFEHFILPDIDPKDTDAVNSDIEIHQALNKLVDIEQDKGASWSIIVSTDYTLKQSEKDSRKSQREQRGGHYVVNGSKILLKLDKDRIDIDRCNNDWDPISFLDALQKEQPVKEKLNERSLTWAKEWSGVNPYLQLCYCDAVVEYKRNLGDKKKTQLELRKEIEEKALEKANGCLKQWCRHLDADEKEYLKILLSREQDGLERYSDAAYRLFVRGILNDVGRASQDIRTKYMFSCPAIQQYLKENPEKLTIGISKSWGPGINDL